MNDEWRNDAACKGKTDLFYPDRPSLGDPNMNGQMARAICATCPVAVECAAFAAYNCERYGIWGGRSVRHPRRNADGVAVRTVKCSNCDTHFDALGAKRSSYCGDACRQEAYCATQKRYNDAAAIRVTPEYEAPCMRCGNPRFGGGATATHCGWECERMDQRELWAKLDRLDAEDAMLDEVAS